MLTTLAVIEETDPLLLAPLAGSVPTGGMSGAPVFDRDGRLIGIFVSVTRASSGSGSSYRYNAAPIASVRRPPRHAGTLAPAGRAQILENPPGIE